MSAVNTLRQWVISQTHMTFPVGKFHITLIVQIYIRALCMKDRTLYRIGEGSLTVARPNSGGFRHGQLVPLQEKCLCF